MKRKLYNEKYENEKYEDLIENLMIENQKKYGKCNIVIKKSTISKAGKGVFSKIEMPKNHMVGYYTGKRATNINSKYLMEVNPNLVIDATGRLANFTRYIQHSDNPRTINIKIVSCDKWPYNKFVTTKKVNIGDELFFDYGPEYWWGHGIIPQNPPYPKKQK